jgi:hypothetical protein
MRSTYLPADPTFSANAGTLGMIASWMTFLLSEVYAIVSGLTYALQGSAVENGPFLSVMALLVIVMGQSE